MTRVGFIGLGVMGAPMARRLQAAGHALTVNTRTRSKALTLLADGAAWAETAAGVVAASDVVITMLPDSSDVAGIAPAVTRDGLLWIDMSTIAPSIWRTLAAEAGRRGVGCVDAPVSGGQAGAENGSLIIMAGGETRHVRAAEPLLRELGRVVHVGEIGAGQVTKACNQVLTGGTIALVSEALTLARKAGVDPVRVREALLGGFAASRILEAHGQRMLDGDFEPGFQARLHRKDLSIVLDEARSLDTAAPLTAAAAQLLDALVARGDGGRDSVALYKLYGEMAGL